MAPTNPILILFIERFSRKLNSLNGEDIVYKAVLQISFRVYTPLHKANGVIMLHGAFGVVLIEVPQQGFEYRNKAILRGFRYRSE